MACINCNSEWLYISTKQKQKNKTCYDCYQLQKKLHQQYHNLEDNAKKFIQNNKLDLAINNLKKAHELRNYGIKFHGPLNSGHEYFTNIFIPELINMINFNKNDHIYCLSQWEKMYSLLKSDEDTD